jgi:hypothetical protein
MRRGSRPGERRGGRSRGTANRRTLLTDRILAIGSDHPAASQRALLRKLVKDRQLPADTRIAVAPRCFPPKRASRIGQTGALGGSRTTIAQELRARDGAAGASMRSSTGAQAHATVPTGDWNLKALEALVGVIQDASANPKARRRAAQKIAELLLPKVGKKPKIIPDEYGFWISPNLASAYRDLQLELQALVNEPTRKIPAIAEQIKKLEARSAAILRRLEAACPTKYGDKEAAKDLGRLIELRALRDNGTALTEVQQAEEVHLWARYAVFRASPESMARRRRQALEEADRRFRMSRLAGNFRAPPLSRKERHELKLLRLFYPAEPNQSLSPFEDDEFETRRNHPFAHELPAPDGNFYPRQLYPRHCKVQPADPRGHAVDDLANDRKRLDELSKARLDQTTLTPQEDAEETQLAARIVIYEHDPELLDETRIRELEERWAGSPLTASEEGELRDLRECYPEFAAVMDLMDLRYLYERTRELEIARKAGLDFDAMCQQAEVICLRLRDPSKFIHEWQARRFLRDGKAAGAAGREP